MLRKLFKYDFRCSVRRILPIYVIFCVVSVLFRAVDNVDLTQFGVLAILIANIIEIAFVALCVINIVAGFGYALKRFKENLFTDEGYLMHTLPVKASQHIWSKAFNAILWGIFSAIMVLVGMLLSGNLAFSELKDIIKALASIHWTVENILSAGLVLIACISWILVITMFAVFCITIENSFKKLKNPAVYVPVLAVAIVVVSEITSVVINLFSKWIDKLDVSYVAKLNICEAIACGFMILLSAIFYFVSLHLMKHRLNLE